MDQAVNFYELKTQLADLGFADPDIVDRLRERIVGSTRDFRLLHRENLNGLVAEYSFDIQRHEPDGPLQFDHLEAAIYRPGKEEYFYAIFSPDITRDEVDQILQQGIKGPFVEENLPDYFDRAKISNILNQNNMNTQNLSYLQKQLLNLGFGEGMNKELEKNIEAKTPEFTLNSTNDYNKQNVDYKLHFKAGEKDEMYFFNKYDASLQGKDMAQTFYINKGSGITAKEAYNLMEGRAVHKELENKEGEKYKAWVVIDKDNMTENGNHKLNTFSDGWNYKPERAIDKMAIVGIDEPGNRDKLMKSLEKGNRHQVEALRDGKPVKLFIEANPTEHRVNLTNYKGEAQQLEHYKKPEAKQEQKKAETQTQETSKKKSKGKKMSV
ncbi:MAG: hypothetical protein JWQ34_2661 [Mucilaginibacter sp.]|uniref:hypothetical protein n=1 Tax=Mucilaginibacter sp. TaxID=1882438 RepID=UPI002604687B|nr:hypothetical protein [Mucilaginibacter sp.]MDB5004436.1 hypothetical protein [Mucilaginibacter sp.]